MSAAVFSDRAHDNGSNGPSMCSCQIPVQADAFAAHPCNLLVWAAHTALQGVCLPNKHCTLGAMERNELTYHRLARVLVGKERAFAVPDKEREIEKVLHGLLKVVWVDNKFENICVPVDLG